MLKTCMRAPANAHRPHHDAPRSGTTALELALLSPACLVALYAIVSAGSALAEQHPGARGKPVAQRPVAARAPSDRLMASERLGSVAPALAACSTSGI